MSKILLVTLVVSLALVSLGFASNDWNAVRSYLRQCAYRFMHSNGYQKYPTVYNMLNDPRNYALAVYVVVWTNTSGGYDAWYNTGGVNIDYNKMLQDFRTDYDHFILPPVQKVTGNYYTSNLALLLQARKAAGIIVVAKDLTEVALVDVIGGTTVPVVVYYNLSPNAQ